MPDNGNIGLNAKGAFTSMKEELWQEEKRARKLLAAREFPGDSS
jgi:hypothetical protein